MPAKKATRSASAKRSRSRSTSKKPTSPRKASPVKASTSPSRSHATVQQSIDEVKRVDAILSGGHVERKSHSQSAAIPLWKHWAGVFAFLVATYVWLYWSYQGYLSRKAAGK